MQDDRTDQPTPIHRRHGGRGTGIARRGGRRLLGAVQLFVLMTAAGALILAGAMFWALGALPTDAATNDGVPPSLLIESADGAPVARRGSFRLAEAPFEDFPEHLLDAVIAIEDRTFRRHWGVDFRGTARAFFRNVAAGRIVEGGSTITQQLVKVTMLTNERTMSRKLREMIIAVWLETRLGKADIMARYLNAVYMGRGAHGMPAAARLYFNKDVSKLSLAESAMLAGLIRAPANWNPLRDPRAAQDRAEVVLAAMVENRAIDRETAEAAKASPAELEPMPDHSAGESWFADWAATEAIRLPGRFDKNMRVRTTLDPGLQEIAEEVVGAALDGPGARRNVSQAALVALRPDGAVLAMVGGRDYAESSFNRAVQSRRQPGSAFKVFVYHAALRNGFSPDDRIEDAAVEVDGWSPANYDNRFRGRVTLAEAFARSLNSATVQLALEVGIDEVAASARDLGIESDLMETPSLALGTSGVSLLEMTGAFAAIRAGVAPVRPWGITAAGPEDEGRLVVTGAPAGRQQALGPEHGPLVELLRGVVQRGTGRAAAIDGSAAGKTGTSQNHRDAWFVGFTDELVVGVWVGNDDDAPMDGVVGGQLPAEIWRDFAQRATPRLPESDQPASPRIPARLVGLSTPETATIPDDTNPRRSTEGTPACNVNACRSRYRSFRESDCTYQPYGGGARRLCPLGGTEAARSEMRSEARSDSPARRRAPTAGRQCNYRTCATAYRSFRSSDCTYQPYGGGPRRICQR